MYSSTFTYKSVQLYEAGNSGVRGSLIKRLFHLVYWLIYYEVQLLIY